MSRFWGTLYRECFAPGEPPVETNPYYQRWYYDPEAGLAIRLPRNTMGEEIGKRNAADLRMESVTTPTGEMQAVTLQKC